MAAVYPPPAAARRATALGYHRSPLLRFLLCAIPSVVLVMAAAVLLFGALDDGVPSRLPGLTLLGGWVLEAAALTALFLLVQGRAGAWWLDGLLAGWIGWIFRGPVLMLTVADVIAGGREPWWTLTQRWLLTYSLAGLLLALLARRLRRPASGAAP